MKLLLLSLSLIVLSSCSSTQKKYAEKVGCKEDEAQIIQDSSAALIYESYTVTCKGKTYKCTETALGTSNCSQK